jgi:hypothetical protein
MRTGSLPAAQGAEPDAAPQHRQVWPGLAPHRICRAAGDRVRCLRPPFATVGQSPLSTIPLEVEYPLACVHCFVHILNLVKRSTSKQGAKPATQAALGLFDGQPRGESSSVTRWFEISGSSSPSVAALSRWFASPRRGWSSGSKRRREPVLLAETPSDASAEHWRRRTFAAGGPDLTGGAAAGPQNVTISSSLEVSLTVNSTPAFRAARSAMRSRAARTS